MIEMPVEKTANFIRIRVASPKKFIRFRVKSFGKGIKAVIGFMKKGGSKVQSLLFSRKMWTLAKAKKWVKEHNYTIEESFWVTDVSIDPETMDLVLEESVASDEDEETPLDVRKMKEDEFKWLIE